MTDRCTPSRCQILFMCHPSRECSWLPTIGLKRRRTTHQPLEEHGWPRTTTASSSTGTKARSSKWFKWARTPTPPWPKLQRDQGLLIILSNNWSPLSMYFQLLWVSCTTATKPSRNSNWQWKIHCWQESSAWIQCKRKGLEGSLSRWPDRKGQQHCNRHTNWGLGHF